MLKIIAIVFMTIDHLGVVFWPDLLIFRFIGRLAFPLFAYQVGISLEKTSSQIKYLERLVIWGFISQIPYMLIFGLSLNIMFTLSLGVGFLIFLKDAKPYQRILVLIIVMFMAHITHADYGAYGVFLIVLFSEFESKDKTLVFVLFIFSSLVFSVSIGLLWQTLCIAVYPLLLLKLPHLKTPKWLFYAYYPVHLLILFLVVIIR